VDAAYPRPPPSSTAPLPHLGAGLYVASKADDHAPLIGAFGLFAMLATLTMLTKKVAWFVSSFARRRSSTRGPAA